MPSFNNIFSVPTGGAIGISLTTAVSGTVTLSRAVSGSGGVGAYTNLYSGQPLSDTGEATFFLDIGDDTPAPLLNGTQYVYKLVDVNGTVTSNPVTTPSNVVYEFVPFTQITIALLQGAINASRDAGTLPNGIKPARVMAAMPLAGYPPLPSIFVAPELVEQSALPVGGDVEQPGDLIQPGKTNVWTMTEMARRLYRITVISDNSVERNYYREMVIAVMKVSVAYALSQLGADLSRNYIAENYQEVDQTNLTIPGFYACDIMFEFTGMSNIKVTTSYNLIETITDTLSDPAGTPIVNTIVPHL